MHSCGGFLHSKSVIWTGKHTRVSTRPCLARHSLKGSAYLHSRRAEQVKVCSSSESSAQQTEDAATSSAAGTTASSGSASTKPAKSEAEKRVSSFVKSTATTFAPRASTATRNPAFKGSLLYTIFGAQAWISLLVGGLLSFNVMFPTDKPSIARLIGMWSVWMFTIPALRARECTAAEKDALNLLFLLVPLLNVGLPFVWKSFPFIFSADCAALGAVYLWKIGLPGQERSDGV